MDVYEAQPVSMLESEHDLEHLLNNLHVRRINSINVTDFKHIEQKCRLTIVFSVVISLVYFYAAFISKMLPYTGYFILDSMKDDYYVCYLLPLMIVPTIVVVYLEWLSMTFFQHN